MGSATDENDEASVTFSLGSHSDDNEGIESPENRQTETPSDVPNVQSPTEAKQVFGRKKQAWLNEIAGVGGNNPLLKFCDDDDCRIDLSTTHPGSLPQFISGNTVLLSQLIRDDRALRFAKIAAGRVAEKATEMRAVRGLDTVHLAIGTAEWSFEGESYRAPILLRPLAIRRFGEDFQLRLRQRPLFNVALARAVRRQFGIKLDPTEYLKLSQVSGVFKPQPVIDRLRRETAGIQDFSVFPRLVASTFLDVSFAMINDVRDVETPIIEALAGVESAVERVGSSRKSVTAVHGNDRSPETDTYLYNADFQQEEVLEEIVAGNSITVHTLPGTGGMQTVVNALGELVRRGKRVLVVSPRRSTLDGISNRLKRVSLTGMGASSRLVRRNLVEAIARNEHVKKGNDAEVDAALVRLRTTIVDYLRALIRADDKLGVSPLETLHVLSTLTREVNPPTTKVRLSDAGLIRLAIDRSAELDALSEVARLGQFNYGPDDSPWYNVSFESREEAEQAYEMAVGLAETKLPRLISMAADVISQTTMRPYDTVAELGVYLRLLTGLRETLDRFLPEVFDRSLTEIIVAHAPKGSDDMTSGNRRRLKKLAKEFVRPGVSVDDMYSRLVQIQQQRVLWQRYSSVVGARPEIPSGLGDLVSVYQGAYEDLDQLDVVLDPEQTGTRLRNMPLNELAHLMTELARDSDVLHNIHERSALVQQLYDAHLGDLLDDLSTRHVPASSVSSELEQAWWQSALEYMLKNNKKLLGANTSIVERLEDDYKLVDDAHARSNGPALARELAKIWRVAVADYPAEASSLKTSLRSGDVSVEELAYKAPNLLRALVPVWMVSPYEVPQIPRSMQFDTVLLIDSSATFLSEQIGALTRATQVVAFGDPVTQKPSTFEIGVTNAPAEVFSGDSSAFEELARVLPNYTLTHSYRAGGADLLELVNQRFYDRQITAFPWAGSLLGESSIEHVVVPDGQGLPDAKTGAVESTDAEVERVLGLIIRHAAETPNDSLMVLATNERHARRIQQAVLEAFSRYEVLNRFLLKDHIEPFIVLPVEQAVAQSRDRTIFSIGYGKTPHGRVLSSFGPLSEPGSEWLVAVAMTRARKSMTIVSSFDASEVDLTRVKHGALELIEIMSSGSPEIKGKKLPEEIDPLLIELAEHLESLGVEVELDYYGEIQLAAKFNGKAVAIELDAEVKGRSLREILRIRPVLLRRLGWQYQRVHSFDLFANPGEVALRIAKTLGYENPEEKEPETNSHANTNEAGPNSVQETEVYEQLLDEHDTKEVMGH